MRSLFKRIEALEKTARPIRRERDEIVNSALRNISATGLELLISSYGAIRVGRSLTKSESAARHAYRAAIDWAMPLGCFWSDDSHGNWITVAS
jgi:hypothetical protein